jgi:hypothetical protein
MLRVARRLAFTLASLGGLAACASQPRAADSSSGTAASASAAPSGNAWFPLFDGTSTSRWRAYRQQDLGKGWSIADGSLTKNGDASDLISTDQFGDFELDWDWKIGPGGNSGIFYKVTEEYDYLFWSGPEYQLLDDAGHPDGQSRLTAAGSNFGLYPAPAGIVKPANEWNSSRLIVRGSHVEHWLNGQKTAEYELGSPDWEARVKASKFGAWPHYGRAKRGHIGIQGDHPGELALRNIRILEYP